MSLVSRVKRLWALSAEPKVGELDLGLLQSTWPDTNAATVPEPEVVHTLEGAYVEPPKRMATIVQDNPLDVFPSEDPEHEGELQ